MQRPDLDALYREMQPRLLRYLRAAYPERAEDIAADVWTEVATLFPRFIGDGDAFRAWLFTTARRRLIDAYRRTGRPRTDPLPVDVAEAAGDRPDEEAVERLSFEATVARVRTLLPPDQADVLLLRIVGGLTVERVATLTGKQPVNVRVLQHRALRRLATRLAQRPA